MVVNLTDLVEGFKVDGASVPIASLLASSTRTLTDVGATSTPPRNASYLGTRGAEFRTSSFQASSPQALATAVSSGLNSALYVSSKIQTFTYLAKFRPSKSGLTALALSPVGGLFSSTNLGATPWALNQPCFVFIRRAAGASRIIVSVMGAIFDTSIATQSSGSTSTEPSADGAWQAIGVVVTGDPTTNNQILSASLIHVTATGTRRIYALGAHRAAALLTFTTNPANNKVVVVNGRTYTLKTALAGTVATGSINGNGVNVADGDAVVIGTKTYTFKNSVAPATKASGSFLFNSGKTLAKSDQAVDVVVGGFAMKIIFNTGSAGVASYAAGSIKNFSSAIDDCALALHSAIHGDVDADSKLFKVPASPTTGTNAGKDWSLASGNARDFSTKFTAHGSDSAFTVTVQALVAGVAGNSITLDYTDPNSTKVISSKSAGTLAGGTDAPTAYSVKIGANWAATKANLIAAINAASGSGTAYSADITAANPIAVASDPGGDDVTLTSTLSGSAGNGQTLTESSTQLTVTAFSGGGSGTNNEVLIGADAAASFANLLSAINLTGSKGLDYGDAGGGSPMTINADVTATLQAAGQLLLTAKASGASGNSVTLTSDVANVAIYDEFGDKVGATLVGGTAAPPFVVAAGARPDNADLRIYHGGFST